MGDYKEFGFGENDDGVSGKRNKFKAEGGRTYRVSFAWWPGLDQGDLNLDAPTPKFTGAMRHFVPNVGYFLNKGPEFMKLAGEPPKMAIGTVIVNWPLDSKGNLDKNALASGDVEVQPWIFSQDKYDTFKTLHNQWSFGSYDIMVTCTDTQFQKMTFTPCRESLLRSIKEKAPNHYKRIVEKIAAVAAHLEDDIARSMTLEQIREKLGGTAASPAGKPGAGAKAGAPNPQTTQEIDNLIDNLLD